ncbi:MAG: LysR family transcriptional regulator [Acidobacteria bacterium RIFCSPLOWO2_02_FULL_68_18]|nr:MAG: LysR family transcriptional regulator [Acidobacteria bacterium RIFCSPLOWO2_02_FULL_68_18]OFW50455.1 MAG: LysR family transcriptional regulator [Acidobacteria bacterium RIFCSPLOWO2_12_FULL_68_19]
MLGLNYHHLLYFWTVAREGGVSRAAEKLRLSQPAVSAQIKALEKALGERLFQRQGRTLALTEVGRLVDRYATEIFTTANEMLETLKGRPSGGALRLAVGVANAVPKLVVYRLLRPAIEGAAPVQITCSEGDPEQLLAQLATHALDVVISDTPAAPRVRVKVFNHLLGESGTTFFAATALARRLRPRFPRSLDGALMLLPTANTSVRRALEQWLDGEGVRPRVAGEFEDPALLMAFGEGSRAVFAAPTAIEGEVLRGHRVAVIGRTAAVRERYYAISVERRLTHAAVAAITSAARTEVFGERRGSP